MIDHMGPLNFQSAMSILPQKKTAKNSKNQGISEMFCSLAHDLMQFAQNFGPHDDFSDLSWPSSHELLQNSAWVLICLRKKNWLFLVFFPWRGSAKFQIQFFWPWRMSKFCLESSRSNLGCLNLSLQFQRQKGEKMHLIFCWFLLNVTLSFVPRGANGGLPFSALLCEFN